MKLTTLSALLAVQLGVAGYLWFSQQNMPQAEPLLADGQISQLVLQQGPAQSTAPDAAQAADGATPAAPASLTLVRQGQRWWLQLPAKDQDSDGLRVAAAPAKIDALLSDLGKVRLQWPVADSSGSQHRFKVASEAHQWQLSLQSPAGTQRLWLGDSAGLRQLYLRRDGETAIYNVALNSDALSTDLNQWLDPDQLAVKALQAVRGADFQLVKTDQQWQLAPAAPLTLQAAPAENAPAAATTAEPLPTGKLQADQAASQALADQLQNLKVQSLYQGDWPADALALQLTTAEGDLTLSLAKAGEIYLAKRSDQQAMFRIDAVLYQQLSSPTLASLQAKAGDQALASQDKTKPAAAPASSLAPLADKLKPGQTAPAGSAAPQP